ncbi:MAG: hypothetical protein GX903_00690 [Spirochaetales bacterium]|nr:hypothetical protein [Spirochaetales bacterium]
MKKNLISKRKAFISELKARPGLTCVYLFVRVSVIGVLIAQIFNQDWFNVFLCVFSLLLFTVPSLIEKRLKIDVPDTLEVIVLIFIYSAEILGEIKAYYISFPFWDTMLHTTTGFLAAAVGFSLVDLLNRNKPENFNLSPFYMAVVAFCFSMTIAVLWEFFEFSGDHFLGLDMQKDTVIHTIRTVALDETRSNKVVTISDINEVYIHGKELGLGGYLDIGLIDTMKDMFVNFIGALVFSVIGFFYVKNRGKGRFAKRFIPTLIKKDEKDGFKEQ